MPKKKKSLYEPRKLTYEEHKQIDEFLRNFQEKGQKVFDLLRQSFGDYEEPIKRMAKAVNLMAPIHQYCENKSCNDRPKGAGDEKDYEDWMMLYYKMGLWTTDAWK